VVIKPNVELWPGKIRRKIHKALFQRNYF